MVGGFVEEQQVASPEEDPGELETATLTAREGPDGEVQPVGLEAQTVDQPVHLGFGGVAAGVLELLLGIGEAGDVAFAGVLLQGEAELLEPVGGVVEPPPGEHVGQPARVVGDQFLAGILGQVAGGPVSAHGARLGRHGATEGGEQGRLPGTVAPDQADLVARSDLEGHAVDDGLATDLHDEVLDDQHPSSQPAASADPVQPLGRHRGRRRSVTLRGGACAMSPLGVKSGPAKAEVGNDGGFGTAQRPGPGARRHHMGSTAEVTSGWSSTRLAAFVGVFGGIWVL